MRKPVRANERKRNNYSPNSIDISNIQPTRSSASVLWGKRVALFLLALLLTASAFGLALAIPMISQPIDTNVLRASLSSRATDYAQRVESFLQAAPEDSRQSTVQVANIGEADLSSNDSLGEQESTSSEEATSEAQTATQIEAVATLVEISLPQSLEETTKVQKEPLVVSYVALHSAPIYVIYDSPATATARPEPTTTAESVQVASLALVLPEKPEPTEAPAATPTDTVDEEPTATPIPPTPTVEVVAQTPTPKSVRTALTNTPVTTSTPTATIRTMPLQPAAPGEAVEYEVVKGDTAYSISRHFNLSLEELLTANELESGDIMVGQVLTVPSAENITAPDLKPTRTSVPATPTARPTQPPPPTATPTFRPTDTPRPSATKPPAPTSTPKPTQTPIPTPTTAPAPPGGGVSGNRIVAIALGFQGIKYTWGGTTPQTGFDCSGFVWYVFRQVGVNVPRDVASQQKIGRPVDQSALQPGDIVFFQNTYKPGLSHDGIYIGGGQFVHAPTEGVGVMVSRLDQSYWKTRYHSAARLY